MKTTKQKEWSECDNSHVGKTNYSLPSLIGWQNIFHVCATLSPMKRMKNEKRSSQWSETKYFLQQMAEQHFIASNRVCNCFVNTRTEKKTYKQNLTKFKTWFAIQSFGIDLKVCSFKIAGKTHNTYRLSFPHFRPLSTQQNAQRLARAHLNACESPFFKIRRSLRAHESGSFSTGRKIQIRGKRQENKLESEFISF